MSDFIVAILIVLAGFAALNALAVAGFFWLRRRMDRRFDK